MYSQVMATSLRIGIKASTCKPFAAVEGASGSESVSNAEVYYSEEARIIHGTGRRRFLRRSPKDDSDGFSAFQHFCVVRLKHTFHVA